MTSINTNYKANTTDPTADSANSLDPYLAQIQAEIQEALEQIEALKASEDFGYLLEDQVGKLQYIETMLKAEYAAIKAGGLGGTQTSGDMYGEDYLDMPTELDPEWNGVSPIMDDYGQDLINDDPSRYGDYAGTLHIPNSGNPAAPTKLAFQMTDDMKEIKAESRGRDIIITVLYKDDTTKSWVIKEGTVRPEPIIISALGLSDGVKMDFSRVMRVSTGEYQGYPFGQRSGFYIHGTEGNDTIIGTQSDDAIVAYGGDDVINGMAGNDTIYGDEYYGMSGDNVNDYGGNDHITGGAGEDIIYAGGGAQDLVSEMDLNNNEAVAEHEGSIADVASASDIPTPDWIFDPTGNWVVDGIEDGVVTVKNEGDKAGELVIDMPPGYNMAYAEQDADGNLVVYFIGDEGKTFKMVIEGFFDSFADDGVVTLLFRGGTDHDIIDFSRVKTTSQAISITDSYNSDDIILGAQNAFLDDGVDLDELYESQGNNDSQLNDYVDEGIFATHPDNYDEDDHSIADGYQATVDGANNQIVISDDPDSTDNIGKLSINCPLDYTHGYMFMSELGDMYIMLVKKGENGKAETIVIKVDSALLSGPNGLTFSDISIMHRLDGDDDEFGTPLPLFAVSGEIDDYLIDSGGGQDIVFTQKGGNVDESNAEDIVEIDPDDWLNATDPTPPPRLT